MLIKRGLLIAGALALMGLWLNHAYSSPDSDARNAWSRATKAVRDPFSPENTAPKTVAARPWVTEQYTYPNGSKTIIREVPFPGEGKQQSITPTPNICPCGPDCDCWKEGGCGCNGANTKKAPKKTSKAAFSEEQDKWKGALVQNGVYGAPIPMGYPGMYYGGTPGAPGNGCNGGAPQMMGNGCNGGGGVQMYPQPVMQSYQMPVYQQQTFYAPQAYSPPVYTVPQASYYYNSTPYTAPTGYSSYSSYRGPFRQWSSGVTQGSGGVQTYAGNGAANCVGGN